MIHCISDLTNTTQFCSICMLVTHSINTRLQVIHCFYKCVCLLIFKVKVSVTKLEGTISTLHSCHHRFYLALQNKHLPTWQSVSEIKNGVYCSLCIRLGSTLMQRILFRFRIWVSNDAQNKKTEIISKSLINLRFLQRKKKTDFRRWKRNV